MNDKPDDSHRVAPGFSEGERQAEPPQQPELSEEELNSWRSITRLLVGGALMGQDELLTHLQSWEEETWRLLAEEQNAGTDRANAALTADQPEPPIATLRHALIGLLFEAQARRARRRKAARALANRAAQALLLPLRSRLEREGWLQPARSRFDELVKRGESVTEQWVRQGKAEEAHSRRLVRTAVGQSFDTSMDQLGHAPALQDLIRQQSAGLTQDVLDEVRERTVTGDIVAERLARTLLRRVPREKLPEPLVEAIPDQPNPGEG